MFLNIKKVPKERKPKSPKLMKLAIEAETDEDRFTTSYTVKDVETKLTVDPLNGDVPANLRAIVDAIIRATSYARKEEIQAWEQEIVPCQHILGEVVQGENKAITQTSSPSSALFDKCNSCALNENLWLCLQCGNVGCGRAQFGGVGGNGHALSHYELTGHKFSVKLGSITPDGSADVFCYICGDEIRDPKLAEHLSHWGLHIEHLTKTEKSLVELQVEQNLHWEFSMTADDGSALTPIFGPGLTGMKNLGNSCYLSSVIQCLFSLEQFQSRFGGETIELFATEKDPAHSLEIQLRKLADGLLSGRYSVPDGLADTPYQRGIAPGMFKALIGAGHQEFSSMRQQDAFEFFEYLNGKISQMCATFKHPDPTECFAFQSERRIECGNCHKIRYKEDLEESVGVNVPARAISQNGNTGDAPVPDEDEAKYEPVTLEECLDIMTSPETLEGYKCSSCKSTCNALASIKFKSFPDVLVVNARRFQVVNWVPRKLNIPVIIKDESHLRLDKYLGTGPQAGEDIVDEGEQETTVQQDDQSQAVFIASEAHMAQLVSMGFSQARCEKALYHTSNRSAEEAMEWIFAHMDDENIDEPLVLTGRNTSGGGTATAAINPEHVTQLCDMGFTADRAEYALSQQGSVEGAIEWLFNNVDAPIPANEELGSESLSSLATEKKPRGDPSVPANYKLKAIICHKGSSIHVGHYVAFIKKDDQWVLFNDEKVVSGGEAQEMQKYAYVYLFERDRSNE